jgi:hypothetical protein
MVALFHLPLAPVAEPFPPFNSRVSVRKSWVPTGVMLQANGRDDLLASALLTRSMVLR